MLKLAQSVKDKKKFPATTGNRSPAPCATGGNTSLASMYSMRVKHMIPRSWVRVSLGASIFFSLKFRKKPVIKPLFLVFW